MFRPGANRTPVSKPAGPVIRQKAPEIGLAGPWSGFDQARSKSSARRHPSPPASAAGCGRAGGLLSIRTVVGATQPTLPAKSVAQCPSAWGPSLNRVVSTVAEPPTRVRQGCIRVPRHSPLICTFWQRYSVRSTRPPSIVVSPKRTPAPPSLPENPKLWTPRRQPPAVSSPPIPAEGTPLSSIVIVSARTADHEPGSRLHHLRFGAGAEQPVLDRRRRRREPGDEASRVGVGDARHRERRKARRGHDADPLLDPVVQRLPPGAGDPGDPGPRRRVPAPTGETGAGDRPRGLGEALHVDAGERVGAGRDRAEGVGAELGATGGVGPAGVDRRRTSRTGRPSTCPPRPRARAGAAGQGRAPAPTR